MTVTRQIQFEGLAQRMAQNPEDVQRALAAAYRAMAEAVAALEMAARVITEMADSEMVRP